MRLLPILLAIALLAGTAVLHAETNTAFTRLADGFDFPVGKPNGDRGYRNGSHLGEDWNGVRGGDSDLGDPVYTVAHGVVVFARDVRRGWGNVVIVRHAYLEKGQIQYVDSLYGHLDRIDVREGQQIKRGDQIGTIGNNRGMYSAHLHFEMRKNLHIGINRTAFRKDLSNYYDPTRFIASRRSLSGGNRTTQVAMNTFTENGQPDRYAMPSKSSAKGSKRTRTNFKVNRYDDLSNP
jgi:murein DD-endopeptidase MepM/ murein hydrolase activator NlpD